MAEQQKKYLECGQIINTHGIAGKVKIDPWCDSPEVLAGVREYAFAQKDGSFAVRKVLSASVQKRFVLAAIEGVTTPEEAEKLKGTVIFASREAIPLPEGSFFIADLVGLSVYDADSGKVYGTVSEVFNAGASDIYTVKTPDGDRMIPAVDEFIVSTDLEKGIAVRPIEGMFD